MTIQECIDIVENLKPSQHTIPDKVQWLSFIDEIIINDVLKTHEGYDGRYDDFAGYKPDNTLVTLIVPSPYDRLYTAYLTMKIDEANGETARYNNSATIFNSYMMEYRKHYNKTHLPLNALNKGNSQPKATKLDVTEAQLEYLKRELYYDLSEDLSKATSDDKLYAIVTSYVNNNREALFSNQAIAPKIAQVVLAVSNWVGASSPYSQVISVPGITKNSKIDLNPTVEQLKVFHNKDLSFIVVNDNGVAIAYCIGQKPTNDYTIQATITEVATNG